MNASVAGLQPTRARVPVRLVATATVLLLGLLAALLVNEWVGAAILILGLIVVARPLDVFTSLLLVAGAAAFVEYGNPNAKRDLAIVLALALYAAASFVVQYARRRWAFPASHLTAALFALAVTTGVAVLHGLAARNPFRFLCVELFSLFVLSFSIALGGLRLSSADLRRAEWGLAAVGVAVSCIGFHYFATTGTRSGGMPFTPVPGFVALILLGTTLFDAAPRPSLARVFLFCVVVSHQIVSFTRGYWLGLLVGVPLICGLYGRRGPGSGQRWSKVFRTLALAALILVLGAAFASRQRGWSDVIILLSDRFTSSFETKNTPQTISNIARLVEIRTSMNAILSSPWLGYGHGAMLSIRQFFSPEASPQWYVHQSYVLIWLKQGLIGLAALLWVLVSAVRIGVKGASHPDPQVAGWCAASAACTLFAVILGLTNYFFFVATQNSLLAILWGVSLAALGRGKPWVVWRIPRPDTAPERVP